MRSNVYNLYGIRKSKLMLHVVYTVLQSLLVASISGFISNLLTGKVGTDIPKFILQERKHITKIYNQNKENSIVL